MLYPHVVTNLMKTINFFLYFTVILSVLSCTIEKNVDFKKYSILTTPIEIGEFYNIKVDTSGSSESAFVKKWKDGPFDLTYTYDSPESDKYSPLYYSIEISKSNSEKEANRKFDLIKKIILRPRSSTSNETVIEYDSIILSGDRNFYAVRNWNGEPNGVLFLYRKKNIVYTLKSSGYYKNDHTFIKNLVEPKLITLENFRLKN